MNAQKWTLFAVVAVLTGATAAFLHRLQNSRSLGPPGLKMVQKPVYADREQTVLVGTNTVDLPLTVLNYASEPLPVDPMELSWLPKDTTYGRRRYAPVGGEPLDFIDLSIVLMGADRTSIHKPQICLDGQGWRIEKQELMTIPMERPHRYQLPIMKMTAEKRVRLGDGTARMLKAIFVYWFVSDQRLTARHGERMWWMATDLIATSVLPRWAYVACFAICPPGSEDETFERMKQFLAAAVPEFQLVAGPMELASAPQQSMRQVGTQ